MPLLDVSDRVETSSRRLGVGMKAENALRELVAFTLEAFFGAPRLELRAPPSLLYQEGQVVDPIVFTNPAWIDNVGQIVFGVRDNKIGVGN